MHNKNLDFAIYDNKQKEICQMKRKIYDALLSWKEREQGKTALMIQGARRVGKSYSDCIC